MGRFEKYLNELSSEYGKGITFLDIDENIFRTFAKIKVIKNGKVVREITNQEFNTYRLKSGESWDFDQFRDAAFFKQTSKPIIPTVDRIKRIFKNINRRGSRVVLITAREAFPDMKTFKETFKDIGIPIEKMDIIFYKPTEGLISKYKKKAIMKYLETGEYRRVRLVDDDIHNIKAFLSIQNIIPQNIIDKIKEKYNITEPEAIPTIQFFGLLVKPDGSLKRIE